MLVLKHIVIENFGPYKKRNVIEFPVDGGVTIVYGENMRGKTSLLNAIRYALFGKVVSRGSNTVNLYKISNWESASEGIYGFSVTLSFFYNGQDYELTRKYIPRNDIEYPQDDVDYREEYFLMKDGNVLGPMEKDIELSNIMPEQVSRFFLFDGELLQEYEDLLSDDKDMGRKITEAIEKILGVPVLTNARADLKELHQQAQKQESEAAKKDQKTRNLGNHLSELNEQRTYHEQEINRLQEELKDIKGKKLVIEEELRKVERVESLLNERDKLIKDKNDFIEKMKVKKDKLKEVMGQLWKEGLNNKVNQLRTNINIEIEKIQNEQTKKAISKEFFERTVTALKEGICPTCNQELNEMAIHHLKDITEIETTFGAIENNRLNDLLQLRARLQGFQVSNKSELAKEIINDIDDYKVEIFTIQDRIDEINESISGIDQKGIRGKRTDYDKVIKEIIYIEQGIEAEQEQLNKKDDLIRGLEKRLDKESGEALKSESRRREIYSKLSGLFSEGVALYRDLLRKKIEEDATDLFIRLTTENEYKGLRINESYGLTIIHQDGSPIPIRSAGAEHIVALSLMGALQKNAPLKGPIIMDSPFGRLDKTHTINVVKALPIMAEQVTLLVYEQELDPVIARETLLGKLKGEYKLVKRTARHTDIVKNVGD